MRQRGLRTWLWLIASPLMMTIAGTGWSHGIALAASPESESCNRGGILRVLQGLEEKALSEKHHCYRLKGVEPKDAQRLLRDALAAAYDRDSAEVWLLDAEAPSGTEMSQSRSAEPLRRMGAESLGFLGLSDYLSSLQKRFPALQDGPPPGFQLKLPCSGPRRGGPGEPRAGGAPPARGIAFFEDFESDPWARWSRDDNTGGAYTWERSTCDNHTEGGSTCLDAVRGGTSGSALACDALYPNGVDTIIVTSSCMAIQGASQAWLEFYHTHLTEGSSWNDYLGVWVETESSGYYWGWGFWGEWSRGWYRALFNLRQWYWWGDLTSYGCSILYYEFRSSSSGAAGFGARVDDILVQTGAAPGSSCAIVADAPTGQAPLTVHFQSEVQGAGPGAAPYWYSGDPSVGDSTEWNPTFTYPNPGTYRASLTVWDNDAMFDCIANQAIEVQECQPPACAEGPVPPDGFANLSTWPVLKWQGVQGASAYNLYFGTESNPPFHANLGSTSTPVGYASPGVTYFWKVQPLGPCGDASNCPIWSFTTLAACTDIYGEDDCSHPPGTTTCCCFVPDHIHDLGKVFPAQSLLRVRYRAGTPGGVCQESKAAMYVSETGADYTLIAEERVPARSGVGDVDHTVDYVPDLPFQYVKVSIPVCYNDDSAAEAWCGAEPPYITAQPADSAIQAGQSADLWVLALGTTPISFQWYRGTAGDTSAPIPGATSWEYTTSPLLETSQFWVRASNAIGTTDSRTATVAVASGCSITCSASASPASGSAPLAVSFTSNVQAQGCDGGPLFEWAFGDGATSPEMNPSHTFAAPGTYGWTFTVTVDGETCSCSGTVEVRPSAGTLRGDVGILSANEFFLFNTPSVAGTVTLLDGAGAVVDLVPVQLGTFEFGDVPAGNYRLVADLTYDDHILFDASLQDYGCAAPQGQILTKPVSSRPVDVVVQGAVTTARIPFPPALVFLHGALGCYGYWVSTTLPDAWDSAARAAGFFSFTPNYSWWGRSFSWPGAADQAAQQILDDLQGLHAQLPLQASSRVPPWTVAAHDMGGLVARVLTSGSHRSDPLLASLLTIYLIATPNSGSDLLLGGGDNSLLSVNSVTRRFNEVYPDFGEKTSSVYVIGGRSDWWGGEYSDGPLALSSAFTVTRLACPQGRSGETCIPYAHLAFDSGEGHTFDYGHYELGSPPSASEVLGGVILAAFQPERSPDPESPAGGTIWGTGARTTGTTQGTVPGLRMPVDCAFQIGTTDGMAIAAWVMEGSADFEVLPPGEQGAGSSREARSTGAYPGFLFTAVNPSPGTWTLRVFPGPTGATFAASAAENSPFGISGYVARTAFLPGNEAPVRVDKEGSFDGVTLGKVTATLFDASGGILQTLTLEADGTGYQGSFTAPAAPGSYPITFSASGSYLDRPFGRDAYERLNVIPLPDGRSRLFTGAFLDHAEDRDGSGKFDTVVLTAQVNIPGAGAYAFAAGLYDGSGNWIAHAASHLVEQAAGTSTVSLAFPMAGLLCNQLSSPLQVRGLSGTDGTTLAPIDLWAGAIPSQQYDPASFDCTPSTLPPEPKPRALRPDEGIRGRAMDLLLSGANLSPNAAVSLGTGLTVNGIAWVAEGLLRVSISILPDASPGLRDLSISNPETQAVTLHGAFLVKAASTPGVNIAWPLAGQVLKGRTTVSANAWGDLPITRVDFAVDGQPLSSSGRFPFQALWDTLAAGNGTHKLAATAFDTGGQSAASRPVQVLVCNNPLPGDCECSGQVSIGEVQKAINMFLGITPPACGADCNGDGIISIGEVQKVINAFLGLTSSC